MVAEYVLKQYWQVEVVVAVESAGAKGFTGTRGGTGTGETRSSLEAESVAMPSPYKLRSFGRRSLPKQGFA